MNLDLLEISNTSIMKEQPELLMNDIPVQQETILKTLDQIIFPIPSVIIFISLLLLLIFLVSLIPPLLFTTLIFLIIRRLLAQLQVYFYFILLIFLIMLNDFFSIIQYRFHLIRFLYLIIPILVVFHFPLVFWHT